MHATLIASANLTITATPIVAPSPYLASMLTTGAVYVIIKMIGRRLKKNTKADNYISALLMLVGVGGVLAFFPIITFLGQLVQWLFRSALSLFGVSTSVSDAGFVVISIVVGFLAFLLYANNRNWVNLLIMVFALMPLFGSETMMSIVVWYINHIGVSGWNGLSRLINHIQALHPTFE